MKHKTVKMIEPFIPASRRLPEITFKAFVLGVILAILMAASNAYLVLKVGMSVTACIPAAVISMAVLKMFRKSNILENNIVQTTASAGEVVAGLLAFTVPALVMIGYWNAFPYPIMAVLAAVGGLLGVLMSVPLRRAMIIESDLKFPEGIATAEVLKTRDDSVAARGILYSGITAAVVKFFQSGVQILADKISIWGYFGKTVGGVSIGFSLALVGAGYVVGLEVILSLFIGAVLAWFIGIPVYGALYGLPLDATDAYSAAVGIWNSKIRIIGVGMMVFGSLWMIVELIQPLHRAITSSLETVRKIKKEGKSSVVRTDFDIPITYVAFGSALLVLPIYMFFDYIITIRELHISTTMIMFVAVFITVITFVLSFLGSSLSSYMCGLIGSSNTPFSGIILMAILVVSFPLLMILGIDINFSTDADAALSAAGITILIGAMIGCAAGIAGDNLQDLKSGQLVGATPWKQQVMLMVGVLVSALILSPIFQLLFEAYGFGDVLPREGMDPAQALSAPKAALMAAISQAIFTHSMDWTMVIIGIILGIIVLMIDRVLKKVGSRWRLPVVAVALGIYMPLEATTALLFGGGLSALSQRVMNKRKVSAEEKTKGERRGLLFASGLIAGESIVGILLAIPFVLYQDTNAFNIVPDALKESTDVFGLLAIMGVLYWFYRVTSKTTKG